MRILILSASTGNGHISAARAIEAVCRERGIHGRYVDALKYAPKAFQMWYGGGYEMVVRRAPSSWGHLYKVSDEPNISYKVQTQMDFGFLFKLRKLLVEERPDWVVCTHSLPQPRLAELRKEFGFRMAIVVTDLYPHLMWLRGEPDHFFVPSAWSKQILEERHAGAGNMTTITGIPIHPVFAKSFSRQEIERSTGCKPGARIITITSGGIGGGPFASALKALLALDRDIHLEVICGRNEARRRDIERRALKMPFNSKVVVKVRGHISQEEMALRMHASEFLISKPGGLTTSECLAVGCPMLVFHPFLIPGQEEGNAEFLVKEGAGAEASTVDELVQVARDLLDHPERLAAMRAKARSFGLPNAAQDIVSTLLELGTSQEKVNSAVPRP